MSEIKNDVQFALRPEQLAIRDLAVSFGRDRIAPHALAWDQEKHFPVDVIKSAAELGMGGICVREDVGGSDLSRLDAVLIYDGLAAACPSIAGYLSVHNMVAWVLDRFGERRPAKAISAQDVPARAAWGLLPL
jgi:alkylation response protein AidB-like acyl-CoA dehydrogenase